MTNSARGRADNVAEQVEADYAPPTAAGGSRRHSEDRKTTPSESPGARLSSGTREGIIVLEVGG